MSLNVWRVFLTAFPQMEKVTRFYVIFHIAVLVTGRYNPTVSSAPLIRVCSGDCTSCQGGEQT